MRHMFKFIHLMFVFLTTGFVLLDQISKWLTQIYLDTPLILIPRFASLTQTFNLGIAFSLPIYRPILLLINAVLIIGGLIIVLRHFDLSKGMYLTIFAMIFGGAISNMIDRLFAGAVIDFISIWRYPVFNLADSFITVGCVILLINEWKHNSKIKNQKSK